jgi:hypothetical protein
MPCIANATIKATKSRARLAGELAHGAMPTVVITGKRARQVVRP